MSLLKKLIEYLIKILRNDPTYKLGSDYDFREFSLVIFYRGLQVLRGLKIKVFIKSKGIVFCGRSVIVEHGYHVSAGSSLILEDDVYINALSLEGVRLGRNVSMGKGTIIVCTGVISNKGIGLSIGNYVGIGAQSFISCQGGIKIGNDVIIGPGLKIFSENHNYKGADIPIRLQGENRRGVGIGNNCWFGANVTVLDGVTIGDGCVIAAGSVINKSVPPNSIAAGVPARIIKPRLVLNDTVDSSLKG